jgi:hypothetical protein
MTSPDRRYVPTRLTPEDLRKLLSLRGELPFKVFLLLSDLGGHLGGGWPGSLQALTKELSACSGKHVGQSAVGAAVGKLAAAGLLTIKGPERGRRSFYLGSRERRDPDHAKDVIGSRERRDPDHAKDVIGSRERRDPDHAKDVIGSRERRDPDHAKDVIGSRERRDPDHAKDVIGSRERRDPDHAKDVISSTNPEEKIEREKTESTSGGIPLPKLRVRGGQIERMSAPADGLADEVRAAGLRRSDRQVELLVADCGSDEVRRQLAWWPRRDTKWCADKPGAAERWFEKMCRERELEPSNGDGGAKPLLSPDAVAVLKAELHDRRVTKGAVARALLSVGAPDIDHLTAESRRALLAALEAS